MTYEWELVEENYVDVLRPSTRLDQVTLKAGDIATYESGLQLDAGATSIRLISGPCTIPAPSGYKWRFSDHRRTPGDFLPPSADAKTPRLQAADDLVRIEHKSPRGLLKGREVVITWAMEKLAEGCHYTRPGHELVGCIAIRKQDQAVVTYGGLVSPRGKQVCKAGKTIGGEKFILPLDGHAWKATSIKIPAASPPPRTSRLQRIASMVN